MNTILISNKMTISYTDKEVFINEIPVHTSNSQSFSEYAYQEMRSYYHELLTNEYENLIVLSGSGISSVVGGLTGTELWKYVYNHFGEEFIKELCELINFNHFDYEFIDLEELLYQANLAKKVIRSAELEEKIKIIRNVIVEKLSTTIPDNSIYEVFLEKFTERDTDMSRLKVFTLNLDTFIEQAASKLNYMIIDGFSYTQPRIFDGIYFDYDFVHRKTKIFSKKVFHLYKLHGSIDWKLEDKKIVKDKDGLEPVIMFSQNNNFESAYDHPFFEIISRFQHELRRPNTLLIIMGFGFKEIHISDMIKKAILCNESLSIMIVDSNINNKYLEIFTRDIEYNNNICIIEDTFEEFVKNYPYLNRK